MLDFSEYRERELGSRIEYSLNGKEIEGIVVDMELTGNTVINTKTGDRYPGYRIRLYPTSGDQ